MIRKLAIWLGLIHPDDAKRHMEAKTVLAEAHREIAASRAARRAELALRVKVKSREH